MPSFTLLHSSKNVLQKLLLDYAALEQNPVSPSRRLRCSSVT